MANVSGWMIYPVDDITEFYCIREKDGLVNERVAQPARRVDDFDGEFDARLEADGAGVGGVAPAPVAAVAGRARQPRVPRHRQVGRQRAVEDAGVEQTEQAAGQLVAPLPERFADVERRLRVALLVAEVGRQRGQKTPVRRSRSGRRRRP